MTNVFLQRKELLHRLLTELMDEITKTGKVDLEAFLVRYEFKTGMGTITSRRLVEKWSEVGIVPPINELGEIHSPTKQVKKPAGRQPKLDSEAEAVFRSLERKKA